MSIGTLGHDNARSRLVLTMSVCLLAAAAWLALWTMGASAHAPMHHHHHPGMAMSEPSPLVSMTLSVSSWTIMTIAMMLPTSLPVLTMFATIARDRGDRPLLVTLVVIGYLGAWAIFGAAAWLGQQVAPRVPLGGSVILLIAGAYQFTPLKHRCLEKCRSPLSFVMEHWQGRHHRRQALKLGVDHGLFCVGCCWALMLLMFVVGMTNLAWMLGLAVLMAIEKNSRVGSRLSAPVGVVLLAWGAATLVSF